VRGPAQVAVVLLPVLAAAQGSVWLHVSGGDALGPLPALTGFFGYDEPNYTYSESGQALIGELASLQAQPVQIRTHFLLVTGDGTGSLKWGSTNAYTEDAAGKPVYDWSIIDRIFSTYLDAGAQPFVEVGFMPEALSTHPEPYRVSWTPGAKNDHYFAGWSYPPKDYAKWEELIRQWVRHEVSQFGRKRVAAWNWEVWNEPDIGYWHGTAEEYDKLYDVTARAVKAALPEAHVGGPATTGPAGKSGAAFLDQFLAHCASEGAPLDFISFHAKGRTSIEGGAARMDLAKQMDDVEAGLKIVAKYRKFRQLPIVLSESDPEGCAACTARVYPQNAYRNTSRYAAYTAAAWGRILDLSQRYEANIRGVLTWAFQFEGQPYFAGFRTLSTHGIDKPVLNFFRMAGMMGDERIALDGGRSGVDGVASRSGQAISVLLWNYRDAGGKPASVRLTVDGIPVEAGRVLVRHYRVDGERSNSYTRWLALGSPQAPPAEQRADLIRAGRLEQFDSPHWIPVRKQTAELRFDLPADAVSLVELSW
jgi:xylan 1,4-beta-xylosidase